MKKTAILLTCLMLFASAISLSACASPDKPSPNNPVTLTMWHNYGGSMQQTMDTLIDEFNSTVGKENGININVTAISSSAELNRSLGMILDDDPGSPSMPDIFTGYPKIAIQFQAKGMLANLDNFFTKEELNEYVGKFVEEGRLSDGGLYVFPTAKSTEILYLNQTLFDRFAQNTGAKIEELATFEGIAKLASDYYKWTDDLTPDIVGDGKMFFASDSLFNVAQVGMKQKDDALFRNDKFNFNSNFESIFNVFSRKDGIALFEGYSSDLSKTGDLICSTGSSAGILFYGNSITLPSGETIPAEYSILPYPTFANGQKIAIQRGGGLMVAKSTALKEYASSLFLKWVTAPEQNLRFIASTGYIPVRKDSFETYLPNSLNTTVTNPEIKKMLTTVLSMYKEYEFFYAPTFTEFEHMEKKYKKIYFINQRSTLPSTELYADFVKQMNAD